jgi:hypothetical protein
VKRQPQEQSGKLVVSALDREQERVQNAHGKELAGAPGGREPPEVAPPIADIASAPGFPGTPRSISNADGCMIAAF